MIIVHHFFQEIVNIEFCSTIHDFLYLAQQILKLNTLSGRDIVQRYLTVNAINNFDFYLRTFRNGTHTLRCLTVNLVLLTMFLNQFAELLTVPFSLSLSYALYILKFF